jgi:hypothetical protein
VHPSAYPLAACIFGFQNCWSPYLAWAKKKKKNSPQTPPERKKTRAHHESMLSLPIGCMKFLFSKLFATIFGVSLIMPG